MSAECVKCGEAIPDMWAQLSPYCGKCYAAQMAKRAEKRNGKPSRRAA